MRRAVVAVGMVFLLILAIGIANTFADDPRPRCVIRESAPDDGKCNRFTFDGTKSHDPQNQKLSYSWDLGDGATSTDPIVTHTYEQSGTYTVTLTVTDNSGTGCDTDVTTTTVNVNMPPTAAFSAAGACAGENIVFDASASRDDVSKTLSYSWDFGDGTTAKGQKVKKAYLKGGVYTVVLTVDDNEGTVCSKDSISKQITINATPVADAGEDIDMCVAAGQELSVNLNARGSSSTTGKLDYSWDFGDGQTGSGVSVKHTYDRTGTYTAKLTVNDGSGSKCSTSSDTVNIRLNIRPVADAGENKEICLGDSVTLDGSLSQAPGNARLVYRWDLGDGTTAEGVRVRHVYEKSGDYKAVLTVDDGKGTSCSASSDSTEVIVNARPTADLKQNKRLICEGDTACCFDASGSNDPEGDRLRYDWDFGDGGIVNNGSPRMNHKYEKAGDFTAMVTVDDGKGSPCSTDTASVSMKVNGRPIADCGENTACCAGVETVFDGSGSSDPNGDILSYHWDLGDGTTAESARVTHTYTKGGRYKVVLTVDDGLGLHCSKARCWFVVNINEGPTSIIEVK